MMQPRARLVQVADHWLDPAKVQVVKKGSSAWPEGGAWTTILMDDWEVSVRLSVADVLAALGVTQ